MILDRIDFTPWHVLLLGTLFGIFFYFLGEVIESLELGVKAPTPLDTYLRPPFEGEGLLTPLKGATYAHGGVNTHLRLSLDARRSFAPTYGEEVPFTPFTLTLEGFYAFWRRQNAFYTFYEV